MAQRVNLGVATCAGAPRLDEDRELLLDALAEAGAEATVGAWDDPTLPWADFDAVLIRSTWDYTTRRDEYLEWARRCRRTVNPADMLAWNTDKRYLSELATRGIPTIPTRFLLPGDGLPAQRSRFVVKPSVSSSAMDTARFEPGQHAAAEELVRVIHAKGRVAMVQPYVESIDTAGETSLVYLAGRYSHAVRREAVLTTEGPRAPLTVAEVLATTKAADPEPMQFGVAQAALTCAPSAPGGLGYARVDVVQAASGPVLLELELTEPYLFLGYAAAERIAEFAEATCRAARG